VILRQEKASATDILFSVLNFELVESTSSHAEEEPQPVEQPLEEPYIPSEVIHPLKLHLHACLFFDCILIIKKGINCFFKYFRMFQTSWLRIYWTKLNWKTSTTSTIECWSSRSKKTKKLYFLSFSWLFFKTEHLKLSETGT